MADDLKARVAANPTAALAIGAGVAWKFLRDPPIAMTLIGAGALSLWHTEPAPIEDEDYLVTAQERFKEQVSHAASTVTDYAAETVRSARESAKDVSSSVFEGAVASVESARDAIQRLPDKVARAAQEAKSKTHQAVREDRVRDQLLLGVAGLA
jgi:hypothetical protein